MAESTGGAIAGAAAQALGNYAVQVAANKRQFKYQKEAMALQNQYNREMWDYQNAYNTPQAQMERLSAAGLNPRLMYQNGADTGSAGPLQAAEVPAQRASTLEIPDVFSRHLMARQADAQYAATVQNIEASRTRAHLTELQAANQILKNMQEQQRSKNYKSLALSEERIARFTAHKSKELLYNEQAKGRRLNQLYEMGQGQITSQNLENDFKRNRNALAKMGIYQSDDVKWRVMLQAARRMDIDIDSLVKQGWDKLKYLFD